MKRIYFHSLSVRIWHWLNAVTVILLLLTGFLFRMPDAAFLLSRNTALSMHRWSGLAMTALWAFWLIHGLASGILRRHYAIRRTDLGDAVVQIKFYLISIFRGEENPFHPTPDAKFNPLQKYAYYCMMGVFAPVMILTGLLYINAFSVCGHSLSVTTVKVMDVVHVLGLYVFAIFLIIHVYMAMLGVTALSHIKAMIVGYEEETDGPAGSSMNSVVETEMADDERKDNQK